jgi:hypothetical protein
MTRRLVRAVFLAVSAAVAVQGCSDTSGPDGPPGIYRLERYEGRELPAIVNQSSAGTVFIVSQRVILGDDGKGEISTEGRSVDGAHPQGSDFSYAQALSYVVRGARIEITLICPPYADCIAGPHLVGERIVGGFALGPITSSRPASTYKRVD